MAAVSKDALYIILYKVHLRFVHSPIRLASMATLTLGVGDNLVTVPSSLLPIPHDSGVVYVQIARDTTQRRTLSDERSDDVLFV